MAEPVVWPGQGESPVGLTPFAFYDGDQQFVTDAPKAADWAARKLGWPTLDVELVDKHFYACFEEAITEYAHQVNQFNIRENMYNLQGRPKSANLSGKNIIASPLPRITVTSEDYGTEVGAGGNVDWKTGSINIEADQQLYDLQELYGAVSESGNRLEIRRIFHGVLPAIQRIFGAHGGLGAGGAGFQVPGVSGGGMNALLTEFGFDALSPAINFILLPAFEDVLRIQAINFNDTIRRSAFSFELINNKVRLFPIPKDSFLLHFHYTVREERFAADATFEEDVISDYANVPYDNIVYSEINDVGRRWIVEYFLACAKSTLGMIRSKYATIPIPNSEVTLNGPALMDEARSEQERLITQIRETLDESGQQKQLEKQKVNETNKREILRNVPLFIFTG
jgi:hypothetical protein